ncbi:MAG: hypothetical protein ACRDRL_31175, partial [Sciscionella sp.]
MQTALGGGVRNGLWPVDANGVTAELVRNGGHVYVIRGEKGAPEGHVVNGRWNAEQGVAEFVDNSGQVSLGGDVRGFIRADRPDPANVRGIPELDVTTLPRTLRSTQQVATRGGWRERLGEKALRTRIFGRSTRPDTPRSQPGPASGRPTGPPIDGDPTALGAQLNADIQRLITGFGDRTPAALQDQLAHVDGQVADGALTPAQARPIRTAILHAQVENVKGWYPRDGQTGATEHTLAGRAVNLPSGDGKTIVGQIHDALTAIETGTAHRITSDGTLASEYAAEFDRNFVPLGLRSVLVHEDGTINGQPGAGTVLIGSGDAFKFALGRANYPAGPKLGIDEIDAALIDGANNRALLGSRSPLGRLDPRFRREYTDALRARGVVDDLGKEHFTIDERSGSATLNQAGADEAATVTNRKLTDHLKNELNDAARAKWIFHEPGTHWTMAEKGPFKGQIAIIDQRSGLPTPTRRWGGLHRAIEVRQGAKINPELREATSTTIADVLGQYAEGDVSGMSGTITQEAELLGVLHGVPVVDIPGSPGPTVFEDGVHDSVAQRRIAIAEQLANRDPARSNQLHPDRAVLVRALTDAEAEAFAAVLNDKTVAH